MIERLALKRLTASDLTFFEWHFKNANAGNQKAINLNADVFVGQLYPALDAIVRERQNKLGIDLWIAGPAAAEPINLQRKIIKGVGYKNWRLDGEFIHNPDEEPERFNVLEPGDIVLLGLEGELAPDTVTLVLFSRTQQDDRVVFEGLEGILGNRRMMALETHVLRQLCEESPVPPLHPVWLLVGRDDITEAALGHASAVERLLSRPRRTRLSLEDLRKARRAAEEIGRYGEALVDIWLRRQVEAEEISDSVWASDINAIEPYDFLIERDGAREKLEVKTTTGGFGREFHLPLSELREMVHGDSPYRILRVYDMSKEGARMRISEHLGEYGRSIIEAFAALPVGVTPNGVTIVPDETTFGNEIILASATADEE